MRNDTVTQNLKTGQIRQAAGNVQKDSMTHKQALPLGVTTPIANNTLPAALDMNRALLHNAIDFSLLSVHGPNQPCEKGWCNARIQLSSPF